MAVSVILVEGNIKNNKQFSLQVYSVLSIKRCDNIWAEVFHVQIRLSCTLHLCNKTTSISHTFMEYALYRSNSTIVTLL